VEGGARRFVQETTKALGVLSEPPPMVVQARPKPAPEPVKELPLYGGAAAAPPQRYTDLVLKNISGTKSRRFALLNNQTFAPGESARVQLGDTEVKVRCLEIRERSVVVAVEGQEGSREVFLRN
jgi:sulfur carrier protein ThiS